MQALWTAWGGGNQPRLVNGKTVSFTPSSGDNEAFLRIGECVVPIFPLLNLIAALETVYNLYTNNDEKAILKQMKPFQVVQFFLGFKSAQDVTQDYFGINSQYDAATCPNAFKHTYLAALRTIHFGRPLADELVDAHETGSISPYDPNEIGTRMDNVNNDIGLQIGTYFTGSKNELADLIYQNAINHKLWQSDSQTPPSLIPSCPTE